MNSNYMLIIDDLENFMTPSFEKVIKCIKATLSFLTKPFTQQKTIKSARTPASATRSTGNNTKSSNPTKASSDDPDPEPYKPHFSYLNLFKLTLESIIDSFISLPLTQKEGMK